MAGDNLVIVISGHETCGIIHDLADELASRGHDVSTIALADPLVPHSYDFDQYGFPVSYFGRRFGGAKFWSTAFRVVWKVSPRLHQLLEKRLRIRMLRSADLYIRVWATIPFDREVLQAISSSRTRVASILMGSDVRNYGVFSQQFGIQMDDFDPGKNDPSPKTKLDALRTHEKYADAIFSVPDQMGLALRPYHHVQVPLRLAQYRFNVPGREIPKVIHAPSRPGVKGTDVIEQVVQKLKAEGIQFEFHSIRQMNHDQLLQELSDADVLIDGLIVHGPGWLGFEAMASGCVTATRYFEDSPECFRPPVVSIDSSNIESRLRTLLTDRDLRVRLAHEGRRYVEEHNDVRIVVDQLLKKTSAGRAGATDYAPRYLLDGYSPSAAADAALIQEANELVQGEEWYRSVVAGQSRAGIEF